MDKGSADAERGRAGESHEDVMAIRFLLKIVNYVVMCLYIIFKNNYSERILDKKLKEEFEEFEEITVSQCFIVFTNKTCPM